MKITPKQKSALNMLAAGGALHHDSGRFYVHSPFEKNMEISEHLAKQLLDGGYVQTINCGCTGFWWAWAGKSFPIEGYETK